MENIDVKELEMKIDELLKMAKAIIVVLEPIFTMFVEFTDSLPEIFKKYIMEEMKNE